MKGPYQRAKLDLRRVWECPVCKRRERTAGSVTSRLCQCQMTRLDGQPVVMKLVEDGFQRLPLPAAIPQAQPAVPENASASPTQWQPIESLPAEDAGPKSSV